MNEVIERVARAALARRNWLIAFKENVNIKGAHHLHTQWSQEKVHDAERELEQALDQWIAYEIMIENNAKEVLNVEEAAEFLGFSPYTIREKARLGEIPGRKVGREWRFLRAALLEAISS